MRRRRLSVSVIGTTAAVMALALAGVGVAMAMAGDSNASADRLAHKTHGMTPAAKRQLALLRSADVSTRAGAFKYLRAIGVNPRGVVIQRGEKNYAGPRCPGKGWTCTKAKRVLQAGKLNISSCTIRPSSSGTATKSGSATVQRCEIVQTGGGTATCLQTLTTNPATQKCLINQTSTTGENRATVVQLIVQHSNGPSGEQDARQNADITQASTSGNNIANASQTVGQSLGKLSNDDNEDDNGAKHFTPPVAFAITQSQEEHQTLNVTQGSESGLNSSKALQITGQRERADHALAITQLQNTEDLDNDCTVIDFVLDDPFANMCYSVQQTSGSGQNTSDVRHSYNQFQAASNCCATTVPASQQAQGSLGSPSSGGLDHRFTQNTVTGPAAIQDSDQVERQIQRRLNTGTMTATQHGPVRKGSGSQLGGTGNTATQDQRSLQLSTGGMAASQTSVVVDQCASPTGTCTVHQEVNQNGEVTTNDASASFLFEAIVCGDVSVFPPGGGGLSFLAALQEGNCVVEPTPTTTITLEPIG